MSETINNKDKSSKHEIKKINSLNSKDKNKIISSTMRSFKNSTSQYNINDLSELKQGGEKYDINLRKIKYLRQKCNDLETKFKIEELNYIFFSDYFPLLLDPEILLQ